METSLYDAQTSLYDVESIYMTCIFRYMSLCEEETVLYGVHNIHYMML